MKGTRTVSKFYYVYMLTDVATGTHFSREAESILKKITGAVSRWKTYANAVGIPRSEQEAMATAFHY